MAELTFTPAMSGACFNGFGTTPDPPQPKSLLLVRRVWLRPIDGVPDFVVYNGVDNDTPKLGGKCASYKDPAKLRRSATPGGEFVLEIGKTNEILRNSSDSGGFSGKGLSRLNAKMRGLD